jgi:GNAT superfamily N-acetyltransferase
MYADVIESLKLDYNDLNPYDIYIYLELIKIKKKFRNQGYGSQILQSIVQFADEHNVRIELYAMSVHGTPINILYRFYRKNGFILINNNKDGKFVYRPKKIRKISNK